jgi:hypothetical protein
MSEYHDIAVVKSFVHHKSLDIALKAAVLTCSGFDFDGVTVLAHIFAPPGADDATAQAIIEAHNSLALSVSGGSIVDGVRQIAADGVAEITVTSAPLVNFTCNLWRKGDSAAFETLAQTVVIADGSAEISVNAVDDYLVEISDGNNTGYFAFRGV